MLNDSRELCFWASHDLCHSDHLFPSSARHGIMPNFRYMGSYRAWKINKLYLFTLMNISHSKSQQDTQGSSFLTHDLSLVGKWMTDLSLLQKTLRADSLILLREHPRCPQQLPCEAPKAGDSLHAHLQDQFWMWHLVGCLDLVGQLEWTAASAQWGRSRETAVRAAAAAKAIRECGRLQAFSGEIITGSWSQREWESRISGPAWQWQCCAQHPGGCVRQSWLSSRGSLLESPHGGWVLQGGRYCWCMNHEFNFQIGVYVECSWAPVSKSAEGDKHIYSVCFCFLFFVCACGEVRGN